MRVQRQEYVDVIARDGETAMLLMGTLVRLSALGAAIYDLAAEPVSVEDLALELEEMFGSPGDGPVLDVTQAAVSQLLRQGVLDELA